MLQSQIPSQKMVNSFPFLILMSSLAALDPLSIDMYLPAFMEISRSFHTHSKTVELSMSAFFIGMALGQLIYGPLADVFGRRRPLFAGMILYLFSTIGCALAPSISILILFRFLQSLGGCAGMVITRAIVRDLFDQKRVSDFFSSMTLVTGIAPIIAPTLGETIHAAFGWRSIFIFLACANICVLAMMYCFLPETHRNPHAQLHFKTILTTYWKLIKNRSFLAFLLPDAAIRAGMFAYISGSSFVFIEVFEVQPIVFSWVFGFNAVGLVIASQLNRRALKYYAPKNILKWSVNTAAFLAILTFCSSMFSPSPLLTMIPLFLFISSISFVGPNALACAMAPHGQHAGTASALYGALQWTFATSASFLVSHFHNGTASAMTGALCFFGLMAVSTFQWFSAPHLRPKEVLATETS